MSKTTAFALMLALLSSAALAALACDSVGSSGTLNGSVRFHRDVDLPVGAVVTVTLDDITLVDASSIELGRDVIEGASALPIDFSIQYDPADIAAGNEYSLSARVELGDELLYINDTVHPVLTRGAPRERDIEVISVNPIDVCIEPLPVVIRSSAGAVSLPEDAELTVRLLDVSNTEAPIVVSEITRSGDLGAFPVEVELPGDGVEVSRHRRYELEADVRVDGQLRYHIPNPAWGKTILEYCPDAENPIINDVIPIEEMPDS